MDQEKALEKLHTSMEGVPMPRQGDKRPWLATADAINGIVRSFGSEVLRRFGDSRGDEQARSDYQRWLIAEAQRLNSVFLGFGSGDDLCAYQRGLWNTPAQLGNYLRIHFVPSEDDCRYAVTDAFLSYATQLMSAMNQHAGEPVQEWGWKLSAASEALSSSLLGINTEQVAEYLGRQRGG